MELRKAYAILFKRWRLLALIAAASVFFAGILTFFIMDEVYESTTTAIVLSPPVDGASEVLTYDDYILNTKLVNSYSVLCKTSNVLSQVIDTLGLGISIDELSDKIKVSSRTDTEFLQITARDKDPQMAMKIANATADIFQQEVESTMNRSNVKIVDYARASEHSVSPDKGSNMLLSLAGGLLLGIGIAFFCEYMDVTLKSPEEVMESLKLPVIGIIPHITAVKQ